MEINEKIISALGKEEILAQLAEECAELAHAALKLRRVLDGKNPTPVTKVEAKKNLLEEIADVYCCISLLDYSPENVVRVIDIAEMKKERWAERLVKKEEVR